MAYKRWMTCFQACACERYPLIIKMTEKLDRR